MSSEKMGVEKCYFIEWQISSSLGNADPIFPGDEQRKSQEGRKMGEASPAAIKISKVLERIANNHKAEITSVALAYVMQKTPYVFPIVGGRKIEHLKGNIAGLSLDLSETDMKDIEEANSFDIGAYFQISFLLFRMSHDFRHIQPPSHALQAVYSLAIPSE
jgi:hypothetical protein